MTAAPARPPSEFSREELAKVSRPADAIPSWRGAGLANWPAIVAVAAALLFGAWGLLLFPGQTSAPNLGLVPVEAWLIAGVLYLALAAVSARTTQRASLLGLGDRLRVGPVGPARPTGPAGPAGPAGPTGPAGPETPEARPELEGV
jgi:hypothetical protein